MHYLHRRYHILQGHSVDLPWEIFLLLAVVDQGISKKRGPASWPFLQETLC
jgi:hypothetical protein